jgi:hypothetical protein
MGTPSITNGPAGGVGGAEMVMPPERRRDDGARRIVPFRLDKHPAHDGLMGGGI